MMHATRLLLLMWFVAIAIVVLWKLAKTGISLREMLATSCMNVSSGQIEFGRVQQLLVTFAVMAAYIGSMWHASGTQASQGTPDISNTLVFLLAGSNGWYLAGKGRGVGIW